MPTRTSRQPSDHPAASDSHHAFGLTCVIAASFFTSLAGILVRLVEEADGWQLQFYRYASFLVFILGALVWRHRGRSLQAFRDIGRPGLIAAVSLAIAFLAYIFALIETSVAKVVFIGSASPVVAAVIAWLALRERLAPATLAAIAASILGIGVMMAEGLDGEGPLGAVLAVVSVVGYGVTLVCLRARRQVDMLPAAALAGLLALLACAVMAPDLAISAHDLLLACLLGVVQLGFQYLLIALGTRHVPAGEVALLGRLQVVLAPLWVWLALGEVPTLLTFLGGAVVVGAVLANSVASLRRGRRAEAWPGK